jgi:hypothetical protein
MPSHDDLGNIRPDQHHSHWAHKGLLEVGLAADRPAAPVADTDPIPATGRSYLASDTGILSIWDGSMWREFSPRLTTQYPVWNGTTDRSFNADATTIDELADVLATLISDLCSYPRTLTFSPVEIPIVFPDLSLS